MKNGNKNHLQDRIYAYEMVNACPEWEEHTHIPLSLVDEAIFEASFAPRDEMINCQRTKVGIEVERKISAFTDLVNVIAPVNTYRSIMSRLPRHERRNIIIRQCWQRHPKWSINISNGFLRRCVRYSYRDRIWLSPAKDIFLDITGPQDTFYDIDTQRPVVVIDTCGTCNDLPIPVSMSSVSDMASDEKKSYTCNIPLQTWWSARIIRRACIRSKLQKQYTQRLKACHLRRAQRHHSTIRQHLQRRVNDRDAIEFKSSFDDYSIFQLKYPLDLQAIQVNAPVRRLLNEAKDIIAAQAKDIWDGDLSSVPTDLNVLHADKTWTIKKLKRIIRFFKVQGITDKQRIKLGGKRECLVSRVISLLSQFMRMCHLPNQ